MDSYKSICCICVEKGSLSKLIVQVHQYQKNILQKITIFRANAMFCCSVSISFYHFSGLFVVVSWISFVVPPEVIPGRMVG